MSQLKRRRITAHTLPNDRKLVNFDVPPEDVMIVRGQVIAVCDGVTLNFYRPYPNPSPAAAAAKRSASTIVTCLQRSPGSVRAIRSAFVQANRAVRELNRQLGLTPRTVDFLTRQYAGTVAAYGRIDGDTLSWGQLNDSGVMVLDAHGRIRENHILDQRPYWQFLKSRRRAGRSVAGSPEEHRYVRQHVVNNRRLRFHGQPVSFSVMTGEPRVSAFLTAGRATLRPDDTVIFYTDGMIPYLALPAFRRLLVSGANTKRIRAAMHALVRRGPRFQHERTIVIVSPRSSVHSTLH